ncbi:uncharacterized protein N7479_006513 [Penicillium vulpinum]|uniref:Uncharacterized protein n=1 Tax=Penicillium vulpinum TaxID=29845 RepID=A0A1V6S2R8_9EURO|nr:uncharacterized protein N7479_006513 [Penicillium vulpinum]KAJ5959363.1 hypothetical protein N7479_006513 [Penicillium vulpinum]OQE08029.1 hypothetical protein PENVUL_c011G02906 [Penicillium vulpinum]
MATKPDAALALNTPVSLKPRGIGQISLGEIALPESIIIYLIQDASTLQIMGELWRLGVAAKLSALYRAASRLEALAAVCTSNFAARMLLKSTNGPISDRDATALWIQTMPELPQSSEYWTVALSFLLSKEDRMAMRDALRFTAGLQAFKQSVQRARTWTGKEPFHGAGRQMVRNHVRGP